MALFDLPKRQEKEADKQLAKKANKVAKKPAAVSRSGGILDKISAIKEAVERNLGQYKDSYIVIQDLSVLRDYIAKCIENNYIAIDTETDGLDPMQNKLAGICIYTRGQKAAYIPLNHISYITKEKVLGQLDENDCRGEFERIIAAKIDIDMFNAKFDIRFLRNQLGLKDIYCTWDAYLASRLLNENEPQKGLKALHNKYCLDGHGDAFKFDELFKGIPFTMIPINVGYLYAAHDPEITCELCDYQRQFLDPNSPDCVGSLQGVSWVFHNIEMPCLPVVADMEDNGIALDFDYSARLSEKYNSLLEEKTKAFYNIINSIGIWTKIYDYKTKHPNNKLDDPINMGSPTQVAILLYDILRIEPPDPRSPRGTGEAILQKMESPVAQAILDYREMAKLVSTYIDKLPKCANPKDGRIHCSFNQYGADTGRFSSSDPNLQNIPSHNKDIRKMFVATNGEFIVSTEDDYFSVSRFSEVFTMRGWVLADRLVSGDVLINCDEQYLIRNIETQKSNVLLYI